MNKLGVTAEGGLANFSDSDIELSPQVTDRFGLTLPQLDLNQAKQGQGFPLPVTFLAGAGQAVEIGALSLRVFVCVEMQLTK